MVRLAFLARQSVDLTQYMSTVWGVHKTDIGHSI